MTGSYEKCKTPFVTSKKIQILINLPTPWPIKNKLIFQLICSKKIYLTLGSNCIGVVLQLCCINNILKTFFHWVCILERFIYFGRCNVVLLFHKLQTGLHFVFEGSHFLFTGLHSSLVFLFQITVPVKDWIMQNDANPEHIWDIQMLNKQEKTLQISNNESYFSKSLKYHKPT